MSLQASEDYQAEKETLRSRLPIRAPTVFPRLPNGAAWIFLPPYATAGFRPRVSSVKPTRVLSKVALPSELPNFIRRRCLSLNPLIFICLI